MTLNLAWQLGGEVTHELRHHRIFRVRNVIPVARDGLRQPPQQGNDGGMFLVQLLADAVIHWKVEDPSCRKKGCPCARSKKSLDFNPWGCHSARSEERRVGKECRSRQTPQKKQK